MAHSADDPQVRLCVALGGRFVEEVQRVEALGELAIDEVRVVGSRKPAPDHAFQPARERELHPVVVAVAGAFASRHGGQILVAEVAGPYGRADFILVEPRQAELERRLTANLRPLAMMSEARLVAALSSRYARTVDEVGRRSGLPERSIRRMAQGLERSGHVSVLPDGRLRRHPSLVCVADTAAFEAKVNDWPRALDQARTYALWNPWTTVVMERLSDRDRAVVEARRFGIGLAERDTVLVPPRRRRVQPVLAFLTSEMLLPAVPW